MHKDKDTKFFWALDGYRGIAAICIVLYHYSINLNMLGKAPGKELLPDMFLGVDFFFMMSGFVIAHAYHSRLQKGMGFAAFMRSRLIRLYPLYFIGITTSILLSIITICTLPVHQSTKHTGLSYLLHLLFLPTPPNLLPMSGGVFPFNIPAWTLSLEMAINIFYALCYKWLSPTRLLGLISLSIIGLYWSAINFSSLGIGFTWDTYMVGWFRVCCSFFAGLLLYACYTRYSFPKVPSWIFLVLSFFMVAIFNNTDRYLFFPFISIFIFFPIMIWLGAHITLSGVSQGIAKWLGKISYALYISHFVVYKIMWMTLSGLSLTHSAKINANIVLLTTIAVLVAWLLDEAYDIPTRNWLKNKFIFTPKNTRSIANQS